MVIADTGFWLALANRRDAHHENALKALDELGKGHGRILSSDRRDFNTFRWKNRRPFENLLV